VQTGVPGLASAAIELRQTVPMDERDRTELNADMKTATFAGGGLGIGLLGLLAVPILSVVGLVLSIIGLRTARPEYRTGRIFSIVGIVVSGIGVAAWLTLGLWGGR
jgi:hypothetical protein